VGCGKVPQHGFLGVDIHGGVEAVHADAAHLPFETASVEEIHTSHFLEHVDSPAAVVKEFARVLRPGGRLTVTVPYGFRSLYNPFHKHAFDKTSFDTFTRDDPRSPEPEALFSVFRQSITCRGFPWWHLRKHLGWVSALGRKEEITWWLVRK